MELKKWKEYTQEEKAELLNHWWYYFGHVIYSLNELEKFNRLVDINADLIYDVAINSYLAHITNEALIGAMRSNELEKLFQSTVKKEEIDKMDNDIKNYYDELEKTFLQQMVETYNNPEPPVPMEPEEIVRQVTGIVYKKEKKPKKGRN